MSQETTREFPRTFVPPELDPGDWEAVEPLFRDLAQREIGSREQLREWLLQVSELQACIAEERSRRYIAMTRNTEDDEAERRYLQMVEEFLPRARPWFHRLNERYVASPFSEELDPARYGVLDRDIRAEIEIFREENIPLQTEASVLSQRYQKITGGMTVDFEGEERTMPQMAKFLEETDRELRRRAWEAAWERRLADRERLDDIFGELLSLRHRIAENAGCADYREYAFKSFKRFDYTPADCREFHEAVEATVMPLARELAARRRAALEVESLRPWDLSVDPLGRDPLRPFESAEELSAGVRRIFARLDPELESWFAEMQRRDELDLDSRKGKAPGGYLSTLEEVRRPFIFMNAAGVHRDVETLLHESGHAFHSLAARQEPLLDYRHAPLEFAEVASMTMELFGDDLLEEFYPEGEAARAKRKHLEGVIELLPWVARIDAFQHWIYTHPEQDRRERTEAWLALGERFEVDVDWSGHEEAREAQWQRQLHLFCYPFYYIEYGIAQLGALQIWRRSLRDREGALRRYRQALTLGGSRPLPQLFEAAGADFSFDADTLGPLMDTVQRELARVAP